MMHRKEAGLMNENQTERESSHSLAWRRYPRRRPSDVLMAYNTLLQWDEEAGAGTDMSQGMKS